MGDLLVVMGMGNIFSTFVKTKTVIIKIFGTGKRWTNQIYCITSIITKYLNIKGRGTGMVKNN